MGRKRIKPEIMTNNVDKLCEIVNEKAESVLQKQSYSINSNFEVVE